MDYIEVKEQKIYAYHGVLEAEKKEGQYFFISFRAYLDIHDAADQDDMALSVSYADMCKTVKEAVTGDVYDLIETLADRTAKALLYEYPMLQRIELKVKKPSAPVGEPVAYPAVIVDRAWHKAFVAVGSNMGDSQKVIRQAIDLINQDPETKVVKEAELIKTKPWGNEDQADFYNTVFELKTILSPRQLMKKLLDTEQVFGRERIEKWGPRTLDLDLVLYDQLITDDPYVTLPHPLMDQRAFVLEPLAEIAPNAIHPLYRRRVKDLLDRLNQS